MDTNFKLHFSSWLSEEKIYKNFWLKNGRLKVLQISPDTGMWHQQLALKLGHQKMLLEQDGFSKLSLGLVFATESVRELFKLSYPNLFKNILAYLNPVTFFHFVILSDWLPLLLRITFFFRIVEEEKNIYIQTCDTILIGKVFLLSM